MGDKLPQRGSRCSHSRGTGNVRETGYFSGTQGTGSQRLHFPAFPCSQKRGREETNNQFKRAKYICGEGAFQNGDLPYDKGHPKTRRLDDKGRPEGCLLHDSTSNQSEAAGAISMAGGNIPVQLPPIWPDLSTSGLYQDPEGSNDYLKVIGSKNDHIHRRHSYHGRDRESGKGAHSSSNFPVGELRVHYQSPQVRPETTEGDRFLGSHSELHQNGGKNAGRKDQTHSPRCQKDSGKGIMPGNRIISLVGEAERCASGNPTSPPLLQEPATLPEHSPEWGEGLLSPCPPNLPSKGRVRMVARTSHQMEWAQSPLKEARHDHRDRCLNHRLGSIMSGNKDRVPLVPRGKTKAYKLLGVASSSIGSEVLCQGQPDPSQDGQHYSPHLHKQVGRDSFKGAEPPDQRSVDVVPEQEYQPAGNTSSYSRDKKHHSGRGISCDEGQVRLDALSQGLQPTRSIR